MNSKQFIPVATAVTMALSAVVAMGAIATFTPSGATTVTPGTDVQFAVSVSLETLSGYNGADIAIGSNDATDIRFVYAADWEAALQTVNKPFFDVQLYSQDVLVGGFNPTPIIEDNLLLGFVVVDTTGMSEGNFDVRIDPTVGPGISSLTLVRTHEGLQGVGLFTVQCAAFDPQCDIDVDLADFAVLQPCLSGPAQNVMEACSRFDAISDGHIDLADMSVFQNEFTGSF